MIPLLAAFAHTAGLSEKDARKAVKDDPALLDAFVADHADRVIRFARPDYDSVSGAARSIIDESKLKLDRVFLLSRESHSDMYFKGGERILFYSDKLKLIDGHHVAGEPVTTIWDDILSNNLHKEGGVEFPKGKKPEALIKRVLDLSTNPGDWVLDSFAGSGTTGAVAHKMGRKWVMIELGVHCDTHILPRLRRVIDGTDQDGASKPVNWHGGGGFRYQHLAPSLLERDQFGNYVISKRYNAAMLAEAMCKQMAFTYAPSDTVYWQHGHSTEQDFIYVTTQTLSREQLQKLSDEVGPQRSLLVSCGAFRCKPDAFPNLTLTKIPQAVLDRCEWGKDDYSLNVANLPQMAPDQPATVSSGNGSRVARRARNQMALFGAEPGGAE
jgi:adenine-specific DNA-methyltransferase